MTLQQLRYLCAIADANLNVSRAAERLHTSQPGVSKQVRLLETELGVELFQRKGKHLVALTAVGAAVLERARGLLRQEQAIRQTAADAVDEYRGTLGIATTHTQSRYLLPPVINRFVARYPAVSLHMQQGTPAQIAELAARGEVDCAIATEALADYANLVIMPCFRWNRAVLLPRGHALATEPVTLASLSRYPLVTYVHGFTGRGKLDQAFRQQGLEPNVVFTAADADVIKTYVRLGMGVGIIAAMAIEPGRDDDLVIRDASSLFDWSTTSLALRRDSYLRAYLYAFIELFAPHLDRATVDRFMTTDDPAARQALGEGMRIPVWHMGDGLRLQ